MTPTPPDTFACDICGEEFDTPSDLEEHKESHLRPLLTERKENRDLRRDIGAAGLPTSPVT